MDKILLKKPYDPPEVGVLQVMVEAGYISTGYPSSSGGGGGSTTTTTDVGGGIDAPGWGLTDGSWE